MLIRIRISEFYPEILFSKKLKMNLEWNFPLNNLADKHMHTLKFLILNKFGKKHSPIISIGIINPFKNHSHTHTFIFI